ncbi:MAG: DUF5652 family protein [Candidatus Daviesbacteria bacterium]|nr:DUF5652 family protein [Candidatus Daviesbacteria bacterium]
MNFGDANISLIFTVLAIWEVFWKGIALWKSAQRAEGKWFIAILVLNTFGILPIFYLWYTKQIKDILDLSFFKQK